MDEREPIRIVDYGPEWPAVFEQEHSRILSRVGQRALAVEHIGSTAVPGFAAKPIIHMMVAIPSLDEASVGGSSRGSEHPRMNRRTGGLLVRRRPNRWWPTPGGAWRSTMGCGAER